MFYGLFEIMRLAVRCLAANLLRSLLTLLGIIIGVASVIFMMSVTAGARAEILKEMQQLGLRNIIINASEPVGDEDTIGRPDKIKQYGLLDKDVEQIRETCGGIEFMTQAHEVREEAWLGGKRIGARVLAIEPKYFAVLGLQPAVGRLLCDVDNEHHRFVCNIGTQALDRHGVVGDRLAISFQMRDKVFDVVGVLDEPRYTTRNRKALATSSKLFTLYVPSKTALRHFGTTFMFRREGSEGGLHVEVDQVIVGVEQDVSVIGVADAIREILERNHPRRDYEMIVPLKLLQQEEQARRTFGITMVLVASVSLVVGGIGIVNIMLATVTERTREIGIRRACGAKRRDIAYQFLIETTTLSLIGGVIGALVGIGAVYVITPRLNWAAIVTGRSVVLALGISCAIGVLFGMCPAIKASKMGPIEALRFE